MNESSVGLAERARHGSSGWDEAPLELRHYIGVLWRQKTAILLTVVVIIALGGVYTYLQTPLYRSTAKLLLQPGVTEAILNSDSGPSRRSDTDRNRVQTEIEVMNSELVRDMVEKAVEQPPQVSINQRGETSVVIITATSKVPTDAARIAETYGETYITVRREQLNADLLKAIDQVQAQIDPIRQQLVALDRPIVELNDRIVATASEDLRNLIQDQRDGLIRQTEGQRALLQSRAQSYEAQLDQLRLASSLVSAGVAQLVDKAKVPNSPASPKPLRNLVVTLVLSAFLGVVVAFLREHYDDTIKGKADLERVTPELPVLGLIPTVGGWKDRKAAMLVSVTEPNSPPAEAYRTLRTSLQFMGLERSVVSVQITSPNQGESKTTTVCNLAVSLARAGHRVIAVDCDLRQPRLHEFLDVDNAVGLTSVVTGDASLADAVQRVAGEPRLAVLVSGPIPPDPSELLSSPRCGQIISVLAAEVDFVLLDGPPVLPVTDAIVLAGLVDAVIMVVAANATTRDSADRAVELLEQVDAPLAGSVLSTSR